MTRNPSNTVLGILGLLFALSVQARPLEFDGLVKYASATFSSRTSNDNSLRCPKQSTKSACREGEINPDYKVGRHDILSIQVCRCAKREQHGGCTSATAVPLRVVPGIRRIEFGTPTVAAFATLVEERTTLNLPLSLLGDLAATSVKDDKEEAVLEITSLENAEGTKEETKLRTIFPNSEGFRALALDNSGHPVNFSPNAFPITWNALRSAIEGRRKDDDRFKFTSIVNTRKTLSTLGLPDCGDGADIAQGELTLALALIKQDGVLLHPGDDVSFQQLDLFPNADSLQSGDYVATAVPLRVTPDGLLMIPPVSATATAIAVVQLFPPENTHLRLLSHFTDIAGYRVRVSGLSDTFPVAEWPTAQLLQACLVAEYSATTPQYRFGNLPDVCASYGIGRGFNRNVSRKLNYLRRLLITRSDQPTWILKDEFNGEHVIPYSQDQTVTDALDMHYTRLTGGALTKKDSALRRLASVVIVPGPLNGRTRFGSNSTAPFWGWIGGGSPDLTADPPLLLPGDRVWVSREPPRTFMRSKLPIYP